jgi:hypothetical protein
MPGIQTEAKIPSVLESVTSFIAPSNISSVVDIPKAKISNERLQIQIGSEVFVSPLVVRVMRLRRFKKYRNRPNKVTVKK